eukprot:2550-Heterococcus_DN1.PRE.9
MMLGAQKVQPVEPNGWRVQRVPTRCHTACAQLERTLSLIVHCVHHDRLCVRCSYDHARVLKVSTQSDCQNQQASTRVDTVT